MPVSILVAEDDAMISSMITNTLRNKGFSVTEVADGEQAIRMADHNHYDLIITDIMMPKIEGIEVISEIIRKAPDTKIIAITAEGSAGYTNFLTLAETVGASASIQKPFSPTQLMDTMKTVGIKKP